MTGMMDVLGRKMLSDVPRGNAALFIQKCNLEIIRNQAGRRQKLGKGEGARPVASIASPRVDLRSLSERRPDGSEAPVTLLGYSTAVRALPHALACLDVHDPRRRAAAMFADACERVSGAGSANLAGGSDTKGMVSDGGVTTKIKHAARYRLIEAIANGWPIDQASGRITKGHHRVVLPVQRKRGNRQEIKAFDLLYAHCVAGKDHAAILRDHGWSAHGKNIKVLVASAWEMLGDIAVVFGFDLIGQTNKGLDA